MASCLNIQAPWRAGPAPRATMRRRHCRATRRSVKVQRDEGSNLLDFRSPWPAAAVILLEDLQLSPGTALADEIEAPSDAASTSNVVLTVLFTAAAVGLVTLTVGVIYLAVSDFLDKRKLDALKKEEEAKEKLKPKKKRTPVASRSGPKGFGQSRRSDELDL